MYNQNQKHVPSGFHPPSGSHDPSSGENKSTHEYVPSSTTNALSNIGHMQQYTESNMNQSLGSGNPSQQNNPTLASVFTVVGNMDQPVYQQPRSHKAKGDLEHDTVYACAVNRQRNMRHVQRALPYVGQYRVFSSTGSSSGRGGMGTTTTTATTATTATSSSSGEIEDHDSDPLKPKSNPSHYTMDEYSDRSQGTQFFGNPQPYQPGFYVDSPYSTSPSSSSHLQQQHVSPSPSRLQQDSSQASAPSVHTTQQRQQHFYRSPNQLHHPNAYVYYGEQAAMSPSIQMINGVHTLTGPTTQINQQYSATNNRHRIVNPSWAMQSSGSNPTNPNTGAQGIMPFVDVHSSFESQFPSLNIPLPSAYSDRSNMHMYANQAMLHNIPKAVFTKVMSSVQSVTDTYSTPIFCGVLLKTMSSKQLYCDCKDASRMANAQVDALGRVYKIWSDFFQEEVEVFQAFTDLNGQVLYKGKYLSKKLKCASNLVSMYLHRRKSMDNSGIYQSTCYLFKPPEYRGLKIGGYFITLDVCKALYSHIRGTRKKHDLNEEAHRSFKNSNPSSTTSKRARQQSSQEEIPDQDRDQKHSRQQETDSV